MSCPSRTDAQEFRHEPEYVGPDSVRGRIVPADEEKNSERKAGAEARQSACKIRELKRSDGQIFRVGGQYDNGCYHQKSDLKIEEDAGPKC
jgi:hypothetical protein